MHGGAHVAQLWGSGGNGMATSAELRPRFEYDLEYNTGGKGLDEFEPEQARAAFRVPIDDASGDLPLHALSSRAADHQRWPRVVAAGATAALAVISAAVVWLVMQQPAATAAPPVTAAPAPAAPRPASAEAAGASEAAAFESRELEKQIAAAAGATAEAVRTVQPPPRRDTPDPRRAAIDGMLARVSRAYRALDAAALGAVWPGADTAALSRQFSSLRYQSLSFDRCDLHAAGREGATLSCAVSIATASKSGDPSLRQRRESWTLVLARDADRYVITGVSTR